MSGLDDLVATALLGTERRPPDVTGWPDPLRRLASAVTGDPPSVLLEHAALATAWSRAGAPAGPAVDVEPAPAERLPACSVPAAQRLHALLGAQDTDLVQEWVSLAAGHGVLAPPGLLPALLDRGARSVALRPGIRAVAGERGAWLARQRTEWAWFGRLADGRDGGLDGGPGAAGDQGTAVDLSEDTWRLGDPPVRVRWLAAVRAVDPQRAREALLGTWRGEPGPNRAELLATFAVGLSDADEDVLERALDDRRKDVRQTAAGLLARLPGSAYARRMTERARAAVRRERALLRTRLVVQLTDEVGKDWARDGVDDSAMDGVGRKAARLRRLLGGTPLAAWADLGSPADVLATSVADGWEDDLRAGWALAAVREGDTAWVEALLASGGALGDALSPDVVARLVAGLEPARRPALARRVVAWARSRMKARNVPPAAPAVLAAALGACERPWPRDLTEETLAWLGETARLLPMWPWTGLVDLLSRALPPDTAPRVLALAAAQRGTSEDDRQWGRRLRQAADVLVVRGEMLAEMSSGATPSAPAPTLAPTPEPTPEPTPATTDAPSAGTTDDPTEEPA